MPKYKVVKSGFYSGRLYEPNGKRPVLHTDKPFPEKTVGKKKVEQVPSWLERLADETPAQAKKRVAAEKKTKASDSAKAKSDKKEIENTSFLAGDSKGSNVEVLK